MKLAAIYNVWDGDELLPYSILSILEHVDLVIIVWQDVSNFGEPYLPYVNKELNFSDDMAFSISQIIKSKGMLNKEGIRKTILSLKLTKTIYHKYTPIVKNGAINETKKRNIGLDIARAEGCTHFVFMDCDEVHDLFGEGKEIFINSRASGSVCKLFTYWVKPTYQLTPIEDYFVPFIHQLKENTVAGMQDYPFWCDPTRRVNENNVVEVPIYMHHYSYVRENIERKLRNSSAKDNIEKSTYLQDYYDLKKTTTPEGHYIPCMQRKVKIVPNLFGIPE